MSFFSKDSEVTGTKKDSVISCVLSIIALASALILFFLDANFMVVPVIAWVGGVVYVKKGLASNEPKYAKWARIILFLAAAILIAACIYFVVKFLAAFR